VHLSARAHMKFCVDTYLRPGKHYRVVDIGSRISDGQEATHRDLLADYDCAITGVDVRAGRNVDVLMTKPYRLPLKSNSADLILSGQAFEHIPFFWASFLEMARVLAPGGLIFLTAPSRGHMHDLQDCWRYHPDGMRALAAFSRLKLKEAHTDFPPTVAGSRRLDYANLDTVNYYWGDTVGVFQKPKKYSKRVAVAREVIVWWANRVGGVDDVPVPEPVKGRRNILRTPS
jgi:SAM-dependent methyltransferase